MLKRVFVGVAALCLIGAVARAGTVTPTGHTLGAGSTVTINGLGGNHVTVYAEEFHWTVDTALTDDSRFEPSFDAFCMEFENENDTTAWAVYDQADMADNVPIDGAGLGFSSFKLNDQQVTDLSRLFGNYYAGLSTNNQYAAFQIAIWEIVYENRNNPYDTGSGDVSFTGNSSATSLADTYLATVTAGTGPLTGIVSLAAKGQQDMIVAVPLPGASLAGLALMAGLAGIGAFRRRRRLHLA
jgi:hypothetical protein